uniref:Uncharacterized protein n=1 Tax=Anguilla anguilla TaxID=7936 RepID=A0A0E9QBK0_ANGAN
MWQDLRITHWPAQPHGYAQARYTPINPQQMNLEQCHHRHRWTATSSITN